MSLSARPARWSRCEIAALAVIVLALFVWDLWAVLVDKRFRGTDTFVEQAIHCAEAFQALDPAGCLRTGLKGPVAGILSAPALLLLGNPPTSVRLLSVLAHLVLTLQLSLLAARLWGNPRAGLWAALVGGAHPLVVGLSRLTHHDLLVAVAVTATLQMVLYLGQPCAARAAAPPPGRRAPEIELDRLGPSAALGLVLALGILVKPSFAAYALFPVLWLAAYRLRTWRRLLHLALAGGMMLLALSVIVVVNIDWIADMLGAFVAGPDLTWTAKLAYYARLPGVAGIYLGATAAMALLLIRRARSTWALSFLLQYLVLLLVLAVMDCWSRFLLPILPLAAVLAAIGLAWVQEAARPARVGVLASVMLLVLHGAVTMTQLANAVSNARDADPRERGVGMITPDRRTYDAYPRVLAPLLRHGREVVLLFAQERAVDEFGVAFRAWQYRGPRVRRIFINQADRRLAGGRAVSVIRVSGAFEGERWLAEEWFRTHQRRSLVARAVDPDGLQFAAYRVFPPPARRPDGSGR